MYRKDNNMGQVSITISVDDYNDYYTHYIIYFLSTQLSVFAWCCDNSIQETTT